MRTLPVIFLSRVFISTRGIRSGIKALTSIAVDFNPGIIKAGTLISLGLSKWDVGILLGSLAVVLAVDLMHEKGIAIRETLERQNIGFQWIILLTGIFLVLLWGRYGLEYDAVSFIYKEI